MDALWDTVGALWEVCCKLGGSALAHLTQKFEVGLLFGACTALQRNASWTQLAMPDQGGLRSKLQFAPLSHQAMGFLCSATW